MILPAAGAIFLDLEAIYKGKYLEFGPPQARKFWEFSDRYKGKYIEFGPPQARNFWI